MMPFANGDVPEAVVCLLSYLSTVRRSNTPQWMEGLVVHFNAACDALGESDRVVLERDELRIVRATDAK